MTGSTSSKSYEDAVDPKVTFAIRTKAKRAHTRRANKLNHLIETVAPTTEVVVALAVLKEAYAEAIALNVKYIQAAKLNEEQQTAVSQWEDDVTDLFNRCNETPKKLSINQGKEGKAQAGRRCGGEREEKKIRVGAATPASDH